MYFQVVGPNKKLNELFVEQMSNKKYSQLNNFRSTTEMDFDSNAYQSYFIFPESMGLEQDEVTKWMKFYYDNDSMVWVKEIV